jgi:hypothetical protein
MANTANPPAPPLATLSEQLGSNLPAELASAVIAGAIVEGRLAIRELAAEMASPGLARDFTKQTLDAWALRGMADDASVIVSELVTNAVRHGVPRAPGVPQASRAPIELILLWPAGPLFCVVTDPGATHPVLGAPDPDAEAGRGLYVVQALASEWGWGMLSPSRKAVWASLRAGRPEPGF